MAKRAQVIEVERGVARVVEKPVKPSKRVYVQMPEDQPEELFEFRDDPGSQYQDAALTGVLTEIGSRDEDSKVTVKRLVNMNGVRREEWLFECHPTQFSVQTIQEHYGPGEYRITVYGQQDGSKYKIVHADKRMVIGASLSGEPPKSLAGAPPSLPPAAGAAPAQFDMKALAAMIASLMPRQSSRAEVLAELREMREIFGPAGGAAPMGDPLDALTRAVSLLKTAQPSAPMLNEDGEIAPTALISQGIALVREMLDAGRAQRVNGADPLALPGPEKTPGTDTAAPSVALAAAPIVPQQREDEMGLMLKAQLALLLNAAKQGMETSTYAGLIYEQAPDEVLEKITGDAWWDELVKLQPGFAPFKGWCEKLRAEVVQIMAEENAAEETPPEGAIAESPGGDQAAS